jgi:hypothetical protein
VGDGVARRISGGGMAWGVAGVSVSAAVAPGCVTTSVAAGAAMTAARSIGPGAGDGHQECGEEYADAERIFHDGALPLILRLLLMGADFYWDRGEETAEFTTEDAEGTEFRAGRK